MRIAIIALAITSVSTPLNPGPDLPEHAHRGFPERSAHSIENYLEMGEGFSVTHGHQMYGRFQYDGTPFYVLLANSDAQVTIDENRFVCRGGLQDGGHAGLILIDLHRGARLIARPVNSGYFSAFGFHDNTLLCYLHSERWVFGITGDWDSSGTPVGKWKQHE